MDKDFLPKGDIQYKKMNLQKGDNLIVKVDTSKLSEEDAIKKLREVSDNKFLKYVHEQGHEIFVIYTGIDIEILRLNPEDKLLVYVREEGLNEEEKEKYFETIKDKLKNFKDQLVIVPVDQRFRDIRVEREKINV